MSITITITDPTPEQIAALFGFSAEHNVRTIAPLLAATTWVEPAADKPKATRAKPAAKAETMSPEDAELAREIAADIAQAEPEPEGARQIVDAGTGQPVAKAAAGEVTLTMDEVRANATRLAQADSGQLKAILGEFGAAKLSEVAPDALPDFAARVLAALG